MLRTATRRAFLYPAASASAAASGWWLAGGSISAGAVEEYAEDVEPGTLYAGSTIPAGNAWSVAVRVASGPAGATTREALWMSFKNGHTGARWVSGQSWWQYCSGATRERVSGATSYPAVVMGICNGTNTLWYYNNSLVATVANAGPIIGLRWGSEYDGLEAWPSNLSHVAAYNVALDDTQRGDLYTAMTA